MTTFLKNISTEPSSDQALVSAFKETGEVVHLSTLYQRYMDLVFGVCLKYLKDPDRSKDAVMDIFEELNTKLRVHEVENFKGWLHVLSRNHCLMQLRSPRNLKTSEFNPDFMQSADPGHLLNEVLEKEATFKRLEDCMAKLPADQLQSIRLFFEEKKCYNEIAEITGFEWNRVRSYIQNGKRNLKICLEATEDTN
ncbi:MAG: sigma-70 family RNA polymerase sigma factor [Bacteroidota bacterium]